MDHVPADRLRYLNEAPVNHRGRYVLYWMTAFRRTEDNFALQRAADWARELDKALLVFEPLRAGYPYASDRLHAFIIQGMADNAKRLAGTRAGYFPYIEPQAGEGRGLLAALADKAALVVTDDFPAFFIPRMLRAAAGRIGVRLEAVDSCGLFPMGLADRTFKTAYSFRRFLQKNLGPHFDRPPSADPLGEADIPGPPKIPAKVLRSWPMAEGLSMDSAAGIARNLPIDHTVPPVETIGGATAGRAALEDFLSRLDRYAVDRNHPDLDGTSRLSPYLHFGHLSAHRVFVEIVKQEGWFPEKTAAKANGARSGWWGMSESAEAFLDQLVTWREIGFNMCLREPNHAAYGSLPDWARETLELHEADPREYLYSLDDFAAARTHDEVWNAAQRQLLTEGFIHNYPRMLWGKKILEWTPSPKEALAVMIELNDRYALDGRDPNSYSGIFWTLGRYDRPWAPERPVFGRVRFMSSANTRRKLKIKKYLSRYGGAVEK